MGHQKEEKEMKLKNQINSWIEGHSKSVFLMSVLGTIFAGGGTYIGSVISIIVGVILTLPAVLGIILILKEERKNKKIGKEKENEERRS